MPRRAALALTVIATFFAKSDTALAAGVVGDGTPGSCTEFAFATALEGGGTVSFNCGAAPHIIVMTYVKTLSVNTIIHGGGTITLSGGNSTAFFEIGESAAVIIDGITLTRGFGEYGAIWNEGGLSIENSRIEKCTGTGNVGGAIANFGGLGITAVTFAENSTSYDGGAIYSENETVIIADSTFTGNCTTGTLGSESGGAIFSSSLLLDAMIVSNSTFTDNTATFGGAIAALNSLTLDNVTFTGNRAVYRGVGTPSADGGAVYVSGQAGVTRSTFTGNEALDGSGGAIYVEDDSTVNVSRTTFTGNEAGTAGGAIGNDGNVTVTESTFHANRGVGAAIFSGIYSTAGEDPEVSLHNTTVSDNTSSGAGAVATTSGKITLAYVTVAGNAGSSGIVEGEFGSFEFSNSVFAYNTPTNCLGLKPIGQSKGFNISSDASCELVATHDAPSTDPLLGPLADNGGPTLTRLPDPLSPAIDEAQCSLDFRADQRGVARPQGAACDCGAVERAPEDSTTTTSTTTSTTSTTATTTTTTLTSGGDCGDPVAFVVSMSAGVGANTVTATDALAVLKAAIGLSSCELCVCDVDGSGAITATDGLATLRASVGLPVDLNCPVCD